MDKSSGLLILAFVMILVTAFGANADLSRIRTRLDALEARPTPAPSSSVNLSTASTGTWSVPNGTGALTVAQEPEQPTREIYWTLFPALEPDRSTLSYQGFSSPTLQEWSELAVQAAEAAAVKARKAEKASKN